MRSYVLAIACSFSLGSVVVAETRTVCDSGCDFTSINTAIAAANDGDVIQLQATVYSEGSVINTLGKAIKIKGATDADGGPASIIDGGGTHRVLRCVSGESRSTIFQNLVIRNGLNPNYGAGMYIRGSRPLIENCRFSFNTTPGSGAGIYIAENANPKILNSTFTANTCSGTSATDFVGGGAICIIKSNPIIQSCEIKNNAALFGAGIGIDGQGSSRQTKIMGCEISNNLAGFFGGGLWATNCAALVKDSRFTANVATKGAGGIQLVLASLVKMTGCRISSNVGAFAGAGILNAGGPSSLQLKGSVVCGNVTAVGGAGTQLFPPGDFTNLGEVCIDDDCSNCTSSDTDGDGVPDAEDGCPFDIAKTEPGNCGCGTEESTVFGDVDCDGDYDEDDVRAGISEFGLATGDVDFDRDYDADDVLFGIEYFEIVGSKGCPADLNGDGVVDGVDLGLLISVWGPCIP